MLIPKSVKIGKHRYEVKTYRTMPRKNGHCEGLIEYKERRISIATHSAVGNVPYSKEQHEIAFWHEVVHGILNDMKEHKLNRSEVFVQGVALRLRDAVISTQKKIPR